MIRVLRKKAAVLSPEAAEQMLANVFSACDRDPNTVPLETLVSYSNYRKERYAIQRTVIVAVLLLFMLLPVLFVAAGVEVSCSNTGDDANPVYDVSVSGGVPVRRITAHMDGRSVPVYETAPGQYALSPRENGEMLVCVTLLNRQRTCETVTVGAADTTPPSILSTDLTDAGIVIRIADAESGVDFDAVTVNDPDGNAVIPAVDAAAGTITLPYPDRVLSVRVPDRYGNVLSIDLKPGA